MECEIFISMLVKIADGYNPVWQRALALEVLRSICSDTTTMRCASVVAAPWGCGWPSSHGCGSSHPRGLGHRLFFRSFDQKEDSATVFLDVVTACSHVVQGAVAVGTPTPQEGAGAPSLTGGAAPSTPVTAATPGTPMMDKSGGGNVGGSGSGSGTVGAGPTVQGVLPAGVTPGTWANVTVRMSM